jgi:hypothetical protein
MTSAEADGTTSILATLFWTVSLTVILKPFQSVVPLAISSEIFLGAYLMYITVSITLYQKDMYNKKQKKLTKPKGPILGARAAVAAPSPPVTLRMTV